MRQYEAVYILDPQLEEAQQAALVDRFQNLIQNQGGSVLFVDRWERRRLAYEIRGRREGHYVVMNFQGEPSAEAELGRVMGITDGVLRHLIVRMDDRTAAKQIAEAKAAAEAKAKAAAEARAVAEAQAAAAAAEAAALEAQARAAEEAAAAARAAAERQAAERRAAEAAPEEAPAAQEGSEE